MTRIASDPPVPPTAPRETFEHVEHGVPRPDPYHWMGRDPSRLTGHLLDERAHYDAASAHLHSLVTTLREEMASRVPETERSPAWHRLGFSYYTRHLAGNDYARIVREIRDNAPNSRQFSSAERQLSDEIRRTDPETVLDIGSLADASGYLDLGLTLVSPDEHLLAYSVDTTGDEVFELRFRDLRTGHDLDDVVPRSYYGGAWSADSGWFFYTVHDAAYRPHEVWRHRLGSPAADDVLVVSEPDERFALALRGSRSGDLVIVLSESRDTGETWVVDAHAPESPARSVGGRRPEVLYRAEHVRDDAGDGHLLLVTNDDAAEFRLVRAPVPASADQDHTTWTVARPEDPAERLERVDAFADHLVLSLRSGGEHRLRVVPVADPGAEGRMVSSRFPCGAVHLARNTEYDATAVTVHDRSLVEPPVWFDLDLGGGEVSDALHHEAPGHDPGRYLTERRTFPAPDGTLVPATVVRHRDTPLDGTAPALVYGYGAYEYTFEPEWDPALPSLLDRGVVFAHAHVRGGGEGGRRWWLDGRLGHKQNTFSDFIAVADGLADGLVDGARIASRGLSAGGPPPGSGPEPATGALAGGAGRGAVRRRGDDHVRRLDPADHQRVGRVG